MPNLNFQEGDHVNQFSNGRYCRTCNVTQRENTITLPMPEQSTDCEIQCGYQFREVMHQWKKMRVCEDVNMYKEEFRIIKDTCYSILKALCCDIKTWECRDAFLEYQLNLMGMRSTNAWREWFLRDHVVDGPICIEEMMDRLVSGLPRRRGDGPVPFGLLAQNHIRSYNRFIKNEEERHRMERELEDQQNQLELVPPAERPSDLQVQIRLMRVGCFQTEKLKDDLNMEIARLEEGLQSRMSVNARDQPENKKPEGQIQCY